MAFDKTGTLTQGKPQVTTVSPLRGLDENALLRLAAAVEQGSTHPLALAIIERCTNQGMILPVATNQRTLAGIGIEATVDGETYLLSAPDKLPAAILDEATRATIQQQEAQGQTVVALVHNNQLLGTLALRDTLRPDAREAVQRLQGLGVQGVILTGDNPRAAAAIAGELGLKFRAGLLPADKVAEVDRMNQRAAGDGGRRD